MSDIIELFGVSTSAKNNPNWGTIINEQECSFLGRKCIKIRKSQPEISIGTCSVLYGKAKRPIVICPFRLLERKQIFIDCLHLLSAHEPGNEIHIVPEISVPGGSVDYFLTSVRDGKVKDFVGVELQTLDTTGTVWPARQKFLQAVGVEAVREDIPLYKSYGMNWKMTAKTILIQLHHKIHTFEAINKHLVLVVQDFLLEYLSKQFQFSHLNNARRDDPMQLHSYRLISKKDNTYSLELASRLSTDSEGIAMCLGLQAEANIGFEKIIQQLQAKVSEETLFTLNM
ncbi:MAG: NotI family restriction endonuclease [Gammaproteobacteria bacterium]|nr:NotI family restriction endonuclease [Gammaproteobacteria bacterium]